MLNKLKNKKIDQRLRYFYSKKKIYNFKKLVNIIVGISVYKNNVVVFVSDIKGKLLYFNTSGLLKLDTKKKKIDIIFKLLVKLLREEKFFTSGNSVALHLKNTNQKISISIIKFLCNNLTHKNIQIIKIKNNNPHNGCRPKKVRRKKFRKINFR